MDSKEWCSIVLFANMFFSLIPSAGVATFIVISFPGWVGMLLCIPLSFAIGLLFLTHVRLIDSMENWVPYHFERVNQDGI